MATDDNLCWYHGRLSREDAAELLLNGMSMCYICSCTNVFTKQYTAKYLFAKFKIINTFKDC